MCSESICFSLMHVRSFRSSSKFVYCSITSCTHFPPISQLLYKFQFLKAKDESDIKATIWIEKKPKDSSAGCKLQDKPNTYTILEKFFILASKQPRFFVLFLKLAKRRRNEKINLKRADEKLNITNEH